MAQAMGHEGSWVWRGMLKMDSKNHGKIVRNCRKNFGLQARLNYVTIDEFE
jgi:hypothetical protein